MGDLTRFQQAVPQDMLHMQVHNTRPPARARTANIIQSLAEHGAPLGEVLSALGVCTICRLVIALCTFPEHDCVKGFIFVDDKGDWYCPVNGPVVTPYSPLADVFSSPPSSLPSTPTRRRHGASSSQTPLSTPPRPRRVPAPFPMSPPRAVGTSAASAGPSAIKLDDDDNDDEMLLAISRSLLDTHGTFMAEARAIAGPVLNALADEFSAHAAQRVKNEDDDNGAIVIPAGGTTRKRKRRINVSATVPPSQRRCIGKIDLTQDD